jgi:uncharacterized protein YjiS (DUF1127 family)
MASVTYIDGHSEGLLARARTGLANFGRRIVEAREREAARYVNSYLVLMDDQTLERLGLTREEIEVAPKTPCYF